MTTTTQSSGPTLHAWLFLLLCITISSRLYAETVTVSIKLDYPVLQQLMLHRLFIAEDIPAKARAMADESDKRLAAKGAAKAGLLGGIPLGIKDLFAFPGYPTTWGAAAYKEQVIDDKAKLVWSEVATDKVHVTLAPDS